MAKNHSVAEFDQAEAKDLGWRVVDDGVMGGLSRGNFNVSKEGILSFSGDLSLENNGGFSSIRTEKVTMDLGGADGLLARVKGDGRSYKIRFGTDARYRGMEVSFMAEFKTQNGEWAEVKIPFDQFKGSFRGMELKDEVFDPTKISRVGLLLADKKPGSFGVEVDWIRTYGGTSSNDIVSTALSDGRFGILAKALTEAGLVETLQGEGPFTVFAPTDEAFKKLPEGTIARLLKPENVNELKNILTFHAFSGSVKLSDALDAGEIKALNKGSVRVSFSDGRVKINEASLINSDIKCGNGIIHVIDCVLLPPAPSNDLAAVAKKAGNFKTLLAAVKAAGVSEILSSSSELTVLAPTDEAFAKLPQGTIESLLKPENKKKLQQILSLHVLKGRISAGDALNAKEAKAIWGGSLKFGIEGGKFRVNGATILVADVSADNGVIHVIDSVILPKQDDAQASKATPVELIEVAIDKGVPVFNKGNHRECADIYRDCMEMLISAENMDCKLVSAMEVLVKASEKVESDAKRAWMLRSGLDHVYHALANS
ncbi:CIA30 family protein [Akkermansiaceae bacterium]|nr:CIA30 family protein [Akkermansiaceae bacterium]MDA7888415.1 CIA30 family protein [Akkermansiaceae bacterium]MDB4544649.1 CIA30 family protein [Akkermansiaceae bacterium]